MKTPFSTIARKEVFQAMNDLELILDDSFENIAAKKSHHDDSFEEQLFRETRNHIAVLSLHLMDHCQEKFLTETEKQGVKEVVLLVQEVAEKMRHLFPEFPSLEDSREFQKLQEFYLSKIIRPINETKLGTWLLALTEKAWSDRAEVEFDIEKRTREGAKQTLKKHYFVDLESIKNDIDYDLLFILKEDGSRFFSPRLIRSMRLILSFEKPEKRGFFKSDIYEEERFSTTASRVLLELEPLFVNFWHAFSHLKNEPIILLMRKVYMSLFLSSISHKSHPFLKGARDYFSDFQVFLGSILTSETYNGWVQQERSGTFKKDSDLAENYLTLTQGIVNALMRSVSGWETWIDPLHNFIHTFYQNPKEKENYWVARELENEVKQISARSIKVRGGCFSRILEQLEDETQTLGFCPLFQGNIPSKLFTIQSDFPTDFVHLPVPIEQELIHKAKVDDTFFNFLRFSEKEGKKLLLINFQDRTAWKEFARATTLEHLTVVEAPAMQPRNDQQEEKPIASCLQVVTLPLQTDFFKQTGSYFEENHASIFFDQILDHFGDEKSGFFLTANLKKAMKEELPSIIRCVHTIFFDEKNVLVQESRIQFLHLVYLLSILWIYQATHPDWMSFVCKDGVDISSGWRTLFFAFLTWFAKSEFDPDDFKHAELFLLGPALFLRDRAPLYKAVRGPLSALSLLEQVLGSGDSVKIKEKMVRELDFLKPLLSARCSFPELFS